MDSFKKFAEMIGQLEEESKDWDDFFDKFVGKCRTPEKIAQLKEYEDACVQLAELARPYLDGLGERIAEASASVVRQEVSTGGESHSRGYYSPSPVIDLVVGNYKRGKLLVRPSKRSKISFTYGFDADDRLRLVTRHLYDLGRASQEVLIYEGDRVFGLTADRFGKSEPLDITTFTVENYAEGKLISFSQLHVHGLREITSFDRLVENALYYKEEYTYDEKGIRTCDLYDYTMQTALLQHFRYVFEHDEDGYISSYPHIDFDDDTLEPCEPSEPLVPLLKRKV